MNTKFLTVLMCSVLGIQTLHCSDEGTAGAGRAQKLSPINQQLFQALLKRTVTVEEVELLLESGADVNATDGSGKTPLHCAVSSQSLQAFDIVNFLVARDADVNATDNSGKTPLHCAVSSQSLQAFRIVNLLVVRDADVNATNNSGQTPLHFAARGYYKLNGTRDYTIYARMIIALLLIRGANVHAKDTYGKIPLDLVDTENPAIRELFIRSLPSRTRRRTPLHYARYAPKAKELRARQIIARLTALLLEEDLTKINSKTPQAGAHSQARVDHPTVAPGGDPASGGGGSAGAGDSVSAEKS